MNHNELTKLMRQMGFEAGVTALIDASKARTALQMAYEAGAKTERERAAASARCDFDECEHAATHERGCMSYCSQHAAEHDELVREERSRSHG